MGNLCIDTGFTCFEVIGAWAEIRSHLCSIEDWFCFIRIQISFAAMQCLWRVFGKMTILHYLAVNDRNKPLHAFQGLLIQACGFLFFILGHSLMLCRQNLLMLDILIHWMFHFKIQK